MIQCSKMVNFDSTEACLTSKWVEFCQQFNGGDDAKKIVTHTETPQAAMGKKQLK